MSSEYSIIDSFTFFTSSSEKIHNKLSASPLSSLNNINNDLLKLQSKMMQQDLIQQQMKTKVALIGGSQLQKQKDSSSESSSDSSTESSSDTSTESSSNTNKTTNSHKTSTIFSASSKTQSDSAYSKTNNFASINDSDIILSHLTPNMSSSDKLSLMNTSEISNSSSDRNTLKKKKK